MLAVGGVHGADLGDAAHAVVFAAVCIGILPQHLGAGDVRFDLLEQFIVVEPALVERLFDDVRPLRFAVDGKIFRKAALFREHAQDAHAHAVDGAHPHAVGAVYHGGEALFHLVRGLIGEGDGEDRRRVYPLFFHQIGDARREHARFAAARTREHEHRPLGIGDGLDLFFVEFAENVLHVYPCTFRGNAASFAL